MAHAIQRLKVLPDKDHQEKKGHRNTMFYRRKQLERVQHHPYLGVEITDNITWKTHIGNITGKANKILDLLRRQLYSSSK